MRGMSGAYDPSLPGSLWACGGVSPLSPKLVLCPKIVVLPNCSPAAPEPVLGKFAGLFRVSRQPLGARVPSGAAGLGALARARAGGGARDRRGPRLYFSGALVQRLFYDSNLGASRRAQRGRLVGPLSPCAPKTRLSRARFVGPQAE